MTSIFASLALIIAILVVLVVENLFGVGLATHKARYR
jgi:hypothetical protein